jgi:hypothetical protein
VNQNWMIGRQQALNDKFDDSETKVPGMALAA